MFVNLVYSFFDYFYIIMGRKDFFIIFSYDLNVDKRVIYLLGMFYFGDNYMFFRYNLFFNWGYKVRNYLVVGF